MTSHRPSCEYTTIRALSEISRFPHPLTRDRRLVWRPSTRKADHPDSSSIAVPKLCPNPIFSTHSGKSYEKMVGKQMANELVSSSCKYRRQRAKLLQAD